MKNKLINLKNIELNLDLLKTHLRFCKELCVKIDEYVNNINLKLLEIKKELNENE